MTSPDRDDELEDFLARRSTLHQRLADRDRVEPPPELDRLVLSKARAAIESPSASQVYRSPRWALPVALAATLVLTFAVVLNFARVKPAGLPAASPMSAMSPASPAPPPALAKREAAAPAVAQVQTQVTEIDPPAMEMPRETRAGPDAEAEMRAKPEAERDLLASTSTSITEAAEAKSDTTITDSARSEAAGTVSDAQTNANSLTVGATQAPMTANAFSRAAARVSPVAPVAAKRAMSSGAPAAADESTPSAEALAERARHPEPQAWLREIEQLRAAGKNDAADHEMEAFRKAYPSHSASEVPQQPVK